MNDGNSKEVKDRLVKFSSAKGISSGDYHGVPNKNIESDNGILEKAKEFGYTVLETAKDHMSSVAFYINRVVESLCF